MDKLYSPWRQKYVTASPKKNKSTQCPFCAHLTTHCDEKNFVIKRYEYTYVVLNLYPYNAGHLLVVPNKHHRDLQSLPDKERNELMHVVSDSITVLNKTIKPDGINVGVNLGKTAGASVTEHLHVHILPRWDGDTNFLPLLAETKQVSVDLKKMYRQIKAGFDGD